MIEIKPKLIPKQPPTILANKRKGTSLLLKIDENIRADPAGLGCCDQELDDQSVEISVEISP